MKKIIIAAFFTLCSISSFASINEVFEYLLENIAETKDYTKPTYDAKQIRVKDVLELYGIILACADGNDSIENKLIEYVICKVEKSVEVLGGIDSMNISIGTEIAKVDIVTDYRQKIGTDYILRLKDFLKGVDTIRTLEDIQEFYKNYEVGIEIEKPQETVGGILRRAYKSNGAE